MFRTLNTTASFFFFVAERLAVLLQCHLQEDDAIRANEERNAMYNPTTYITPAHIEGNKQNQEHVVRYGFRNFLIKEKC
jgi:hypothetical protein